jgi:molybdenum cofactor biosynthesis protein B
MAYESHRRSSQNVAARCAVITLSDTRTESTDTSGATIQRLLRDAGHDVRVYQIIRDEPDQLQRLLDDLLARDDIDVILTNGGTGISRRDQTVEVIQRAIGTPLPGFGELFRMLSWEQIGSGAMLSRAVGGIAAGKLLFAMPGSTPAVELAMTKLILPELGHLLGELRKHAGN